MFEKTRAREQINRLEELNAAENREVVIRKLQVIKNELWQMKRQCEELRLFLEDKYEVLPGGRHGFAELNIGLDRKVEVKDPFRTEKSDYHKKSFETTLHTQRPSLATLSLIYSGLTILGWIGWLTWYDMTTWSKDVITIFFGPGGVISLGIGMRVIYYFVAGVVLLLSGLIKLLRRQRHQTTPKQKRAR